MRKVDLYPSSPILITMAPSKAFQVSSSMPAFYGTMPLPFSFHFQHLHQNIPIKNVLLPKKSGGSYEDTKILVFLHSNLRLTSPSFLSGTHLYSKIVFSKFSFTLSFIFTVVIKRMQHKTYHLQVYGAVAFTTFTFWSRHPHHPSLELFIFPSETPYPLNTNSHPSLTPAQEPSPYPPDYFLCHFIFPSAVRKESHLYHLINTCSSLFCSPLQCYSCYWV